MTEKFDKNKELVDEYIGSLEWSEGIPDIYKTLAAGNIRTFYSGDVNVLPVDDLKPHIESADCECNPTVEVIGASLLIVHNSYDHREIVEQAIDIMNGEE